MVDGFYITLQMHDDKGITLATVERTQASASKPLRVNSLLQDPLVVAPEEKNDYIQFQLGKQAWPSNQEFGIDESTGCKVQDWKTQEYETSVGAWTRPFHDTR